MEIPVRNVTLDELKAILFGCIRVYEQSYRVSSAEMSRLLANGDVKETEELLKWMQSYRVHQSLREPTHTIGIHGTTTGISTSGD